MDAGELIRRCRVDPSIDRVEMGGVRLPLGVYPVEPMTPVQGYVVEFESSDADSEPLSDEADWQLWPDRYVYDVVVSAERIPPLCRQVLAMMPARVYPIFDYIGRDAFREIDPYISYDLLGQDRVAATIRRYSPFFFEDGLCGFGAMSEDPFAYFFLDEHKIMTIRVEPDLRERVERILSAFRLEQVAEPAGADSAAHEHRTVLVTPEDEPDMLSADEVVEWLREEWRLMLNVDPEANVDDAGRSLGDTPYRCLLRLEPSEPEGASRYGEVIVVASCLAEAEDLAFDAAGGWQATSSDNGDGEIEPVIVSADRMTASQLGEALGHSRPDETTVGEAPSILRARLLE